MFRRFTEKRRRYMKIGIISDVHGNLPALEAVLNALEKEDCIRILCGGDLVGYGAYPNECVDMIRERSITCIRGNHDDMMMHVGRESRLRPEVRESIRWTRSQLSAEKRRWLGSLPRSLHCAGVDLVHASHLLKPRWHYVMDMRSVLANFVFQHATISFNGHTHLPLLALHRHGQKPKMLMLRNMALPPHHRYLINVGSVGQPRDNNPDAAFVTFETRTREVAIHRVDYDVDAAQKGIRDAGLPERFAERLGQGR